MNDMPQALLQALVIDERSLHQAYATYLPLLHPPILRERIQRWIGEGWKHIQALERALEQSGAVSHQAPPPVAAAPPSDETHDLLDFFYQQEEHLYYEYQEASKQVEAEPLRSLLLSHLEDQERHLAGIRNLYAEFLYY